MNRIAVSAVFVLGICSLSAWAPAQQGVGGKLRPSPTWQGVVYDETLKTVFDKTVREVGAMRFIANAKDFETMWKAWRPDEKLPEVDFKQSLVLVGFTGGPNRVVIHCTLGNDGHMKTYVRDQSFVGGTGFGYQLAVVSRAGIKTVNDKVVPAP